jgi:hypothetical protein
MSDGREERKELEERRKWEEERKKRGDDRERDWERDGDRERRDSRAVESLDAEVRTAPGGGVHWSAYICRSGTVTNR